MSQCEFEHKSCLVINHKILFDHPPLGPTSRCRIFVNNEEYTVHILFREIERGSLTTSALQTVLKKYSPYSACYKFCPGLDPVDYEANYHEVIRYHLKGVRKMEIPVLRIDSILCPMWFELGKSSSQKREAEAVLCRHCVKLKCQLDHQVKRTQAESPSKKLKRLDASSHAPLSFMSPASQLKRKQNVKMKRENTVRKLKHYEHVEVPLDDHQDVEMANVMTAIENQCADELEQLFLEGESHGVGMRMREIWNGDKRALSDQFMKDQMINSEFLLYLI